MFSALVAFLSLAIGLLLAVMADKQIRGATIYKTMLIWPYAVAPAMAGVLWLFMFQPSLGMLAKLLRSYGHRLESAAQRQPRHDPRRARRHLEADLATTSCSSSPALQSIPKSVIEAAAIDGARPLRRFWTIVFPLLSPTTFFLLVVNIVYVFFDTFGIIDSVTGGGPAGNTTTMVFKVYADGKLGSDLGGSAAQSVVLMVIVVALTAIQFKFVERKVQY